MLLQSLNNLAIARQEFGEHSKAQALFEEALALYLEVSAVMATKLPAPYACHAVHCVLVDVVTDAHLLFSVLFSFCLSIFLILRDFVIVLCYIWCGVAW